MQMSVSNADRVSNRASLTAPRLPHGEEAQWQAVLHRQGGSDGSFVYAVSTTGVFCRPSCSSRRPLRRNVRFFDSAQEAARAGFRPCLRCAPESLHGRSHASAVAAACAWVRSDPAAPHTAASLARVAGMSVSHFHRAFKTSLGITVRALVEAERMKMFRGELRAGRGVLASAEASGIGSSRGVHERSERYLGMTAQQYRAGSKGLELSYACFQTPLGRMLLAATDRGLSFLHFGEAEEPLREALRREFPQAVLHPVSNAADGPLHAWAEALNRYLRKQGPLPALPVHVRATAFQQRVWQFLQSIPEGETRTYTEVAQGIGSPTAVRAVASACAANNVALLIPCHRVLRLGGALSGYRWGTDRKQALLDGEKAHGYPDAQGAA